MLSAGAYAASYMTEGFNASPRSPASAWAGDGPDVRVRRVAEDDCRGSPR
ncbi:hypothetical protein GCM10023238_06780 [Streptomyces heliomycini]